MKTHPVSFSSLMAFTLNDKPSASVPDLLKAAFHNNPKLKDYNLQDTVEIHNEAVDASPYNASSDFAEKLDKEYKNRLPKESKDVIITSADFNTSPTTTEKRYFITAATTKAEMIIHRILSKSDSIFVCRFKNNYK